VNTNVDGVGVHEFNVADDHNGDIVLSFTPESEIGVVNSNNGANSTNTATVNEDSASNTFQNNDADVLNNVVLDSDTGNNIASRNTGGDSTITTGDANVSANIMTLANNNIAGDLIYAVVNIFGDLVGNIILPQESIDSLKAANTGNGSNSDNTTNINLSDSKVANQFNNADIQNNLIFDANTGGNDTSRNTGGDSSVSTGDSNIEAQVINIANLNIIDGDAWLVIVNEAGNWIGKIIGTDGNVFGSVLLEFAMGNDGSINVTNDENGDKSTNTAVVNQSTSEELTQINDAKIVNNVHLSANTGDNSASRNTNGDSTITTGDANIIANLINFANNNISSSGNLFVAVVNVFGSWMGDFFGPGVNPPVAQSEEDPQENQDIARGGQSTVSTHNSSSDNINTNNAEDTFDSSGPINQTPLPANQSTATAIAKNVQRAVGKILDEGVSDVQAEDTIIDVLGDTDEKKDVNINLAWGLPLGGILLVGEFLRRRFLGQ